MTKSIRLTENIRRDILNNVIEVWVAENPEPDFIYPMGALLLQTARKLIPGFKEAETLLQEKSKLAPFIATNRYATVIYGDANIIVVTFPLGQEVPKIPGHEATRIDEGSELFKQYLRLKDDHSDWVAKNRELANQVATVLQSVNTSKQLLNLWKEVAPYLAKFLKDPSEGINLPALPTHTKSIRLWAGTEK